MWELTKKIQTKQKQRNRIESVEMGDILFSVLQLKSENFYCQKKFDKLIQFYLDTTTRLAPFCHFFF